MNIQLCGSHALLETGVLLRNPVSRLLGLLALALLLLTTSHLARAATLPEGFSESPVVSGLTKPTAMAFAPDGRLFVLLQGGQVRTPSRPPTWTTTSFALQ